VQTQVTATDGPLQGPATFEDVLALAPTWARPAILVVEAEACAWVKQRPFDVRDATLDAMPDWIRDRRLWMHLIAAATFGVARGIDERSDEAWARLQAGQTPNTTE
jgi:hypothetical protein